MMKVIVLFLTVVLSLCVATSAQVRPAGQPAEKKNQRRPDPPPPTPPVTPTDTGIVDDDGEIIKVNTSLISVPVRVMDKNGRFIGGMTPVSFRVFEDGEEREIAMFSNEHQPFTVALMLDMSYSTKFKLSEIQTAAIAFIDQLRPQDRVMVVSFDGEVHLLCEPTSDRREIYAAIKRTKISTGTSLFEAVDAVINRHLRAVDGRKAIILFSDGVDTTSRQATERDNLNDAMELDSLIFTIRYDTFADVQAMKNAPAIPGPPPITFPTQQDLPFPTPGAAIGRPGSQGTTPEEYKKAEEYLDQMAQRTGGRLYQALTLGNLADAYSKIASELREFYSIGFYPPEDRPAGKRLNVKVKVNREGLVVRSREGFIRRRAEK